MVLEEYLVMVHGDRRNGQRQFTYYADPRKKPNAEAVLRDFRQSSQIQDERNWRLCRLDGSEIRWLADYADRVLLLEPLAAGGGGGGVGVGGLGGGVGGQSRLLQRRHQLPKLEQRTDSRRNDSRGGSSSTATVTTKSSVKLPSVSGSSSSGGGGGSSSGGGVGVGVGGLGGLGGLGGGVGAADASFNSGQQQQRSSSEWSETTRKTIIRKRLN